jgi:hypothetical protein
MHALRQRRHDLQPRQPAYQHFRTLIGEHFQVVGWDAEDTGRPVLTTLVDIGSGDAFTIALVDSVEDRRPHALLAFTTARELLAYGPFCDETAAATFAPQLAFGNPQIAATRPVPLHDPTQPRLLDDRWKPISPVMADTAGPAPRDASDEFSVMVLLDRATHVLALVGPLPRHAAAGAWQPEAIQSSVDQLIVPLRPSTLDPDHG